MPSRTWRTAPDIPAPPAQDGFALISNEKLFALYIAMLRVRLIAARARQLRRAGGRSAADLPFNGQEAAMVGVAIDLLPEDTLAPVFWKQTFLAVINPSVPVVSDLPQGVEAARKKKAAGNRKIAVLFSTVDSPAWERILDAASAERLPALLVSSAPRAHASRPANVRRAVARQSALPVFTVDGADVVAVYRVASEAIFHARKGSGPTLIEYAADASSDPIKTMDSYLFGKGLLTAGMKRKILGALRFELDINMPNNSI